MILHRFAVDASQQAGDGEASQLLFGLVDGGERRRHKFCQCHIVIANDGDIPRDHQPRLMGGTDGSHRHHVVTDKEGCGAFGQRQQVGHRLMAAGAVKITLLDPLLIERETCLLQRLLKASLALVGGGAAVGACDAADGGMAQLNQMAGCEITAVEGVVGDKIHIFADQPPIHHHHRQALEPVELVEHLLLAFATHDQQAIDPLAQHHLEVGESRLGLPFGVA